MIWDAIIFVIDFISCGKLLAKKLPVEEALAEDYAMSKEGRALEQLKHKHSESILVSDSGRTEPIQPVQKRTTSGPV